MEKKYTLEEVVRERFEATKQRGKYLAYIVNELDAAGFKDYDEAVKKAIFKFGKEKSKEWGNLGAGQFMKQMIPDEIGVATMKFQEVGTSSEDRAEFTFGRCPLEEGWQEMGLSAEKRSRLCGLASEHDFGIVDNDDILDLDMPEALGNGDKVCRLIFNKRT